MYGDELTIVYDSYSLLKTGMDQTGEKFPLTFKMGAGRPAGYVYGSIPFVAMFGPTELGVRGLSLVSGVGIILLMYFLGKKLFSQKVGLWASFLTSISMWDIYLSRAGFEAHFALFLALLGIVLFLYQKYIPMAFFWGLAIFTYPTFKLTLPLLFAALLFFKDFKEILKNKMFYIAIIILSVFAFFNIGESFKGPSEERFLRLNIFADQNTKESIIQDINEKRNLSMLPKNIKTLIYNRPFRYTRMLFENYVSNLSPDFLFLRGDRNPRHNPAEQGMFFIADALLLFIGFYFLAKLERKKFWLIITWILIVPLATMFLGQTHALRNNFILPAFLLVFAYAFANLNKKVIYVLIFGILIQLTTALLTTYFYAPNKFGSFWSEKAKIESLKAINRSIDQKIILSTDIDNIEYAYPVYTKINPNEVISQYGKFPKVFGNVVISNGK